MVTVRLAGERDLEQAGALLHEVYVGGDFIDPDDAYAERLRDARARRQEAELLVAIDDAESDRVLGSVTYCPLGSSYREIAADASEAEFRMLAVSPSARGRGVGEALVRRCLDRAVEDGHTRIVMSSMAKMTAAARLYRRLGFERLPERDWSPDAPGVHSVHLLGFARPLP